MNASQVASGLASVRARVAAACRAVGRDPNEVRLLAVSKTHPLPALVEAVRAGCHQVAESRVQEIVAKAQGWDEHAHGLAQPDFVLIGHLQSNKVREVVTHVAEFQALDSISLAQTLDRRLNAAGRDLRVLVQVNCSGETTKFGLAPEQVLATARALRQFTSLRVEGLMTIAAHSRDPEIVARGFALMQRLQAQLRDEGVLDSPWNELSMGMSDDLEAAIAHGATTVRVGTAIFGAR